MRDLASEAVLRTLASPPPDGNMAPWMERIFKNLIADRWRRQRHEITVEDLPLAYAEPSALDQLMREEELRMFRAFLADLPPDLGRALSLRVLEGQDEATVGTTLGIATATVRSRIHRAITRLREGMVKVRAIFPFRYSQPALASVHATTLALGPILVALCLMASVAPMVTAPHAHAQTIREDSPPKATATPPRAYRAKTAVRAVAVNQPREMPPTTAIEMAKNRSPILWPDVILVEAIAPSLAMTPMVEIPGDFLPAFEKMIEESW